MKTNLMMLFGDKFFSSSNLHLHLAFRSADKTRYHNLKKVKNAKKTLKTFIFDQKYLCGASIEFISK